MKISFFTQNVYNRTEYSETELFDLKSLYEKYFSRNRIYFFIKNLLIILETLEFSSQKYQSIGAEGFNKTEISIDFNIPPLQQIESLFVFNQMIFLFYRYVPTLINSWKIAWTQYVSLFIPLYIFWRKLLQFIFNTRIVASNQFNNLQKK